MGATEKMSRQSIRKNYSGTMEKFVSFIGVIWMLLQILQASQAIYLTPRIIRLVHLAFCILMVFLLSPIFRKENINKLGIVNLLLIALTAFVFIYSIQRVSVLIKMAGRSAQIDIVLSILLIILMFEAGRRVVSPGLVILSLLALTYVVFGKYLNGALSHSGFSTKRIMTHIVLGGEGIFGFALGVSAEVLVVFVIFGNVLQEVGIADYFYDLANAICGRSIGGPAKVAVVSSALMGMVSGETSANVATTGAFTIPLMKRVGYSNDFAGAVECTASAGGQILPPVMGATAFMLADTLNIPYAKLALAAVLPAILYYTTVMATVHFRAVKRNLQGNCNFKTDWIDILKRSYLLLPLVGIVVFLLLNYTPTFAAFWGGIVVAVVLSFFKKETRLNLNKILNILINSSRTVMTLGVATAIVGVIVGAFSLTGITMTISKVIFNAAQGIKFLTLLLTMIVAMILGMGLPTSAAYVLASISAAPALTAYLGLELLPAHLFVFYFGCMSTITPPVATGAYAAAGLSGGNPNKIGFISMKLAISGFIVPFIFIYSPQLLLGLGFGSMWSTLFSFVVTAFGLILLSSVLEGTMFASLEIWKRFALLVLAVALIWPRVMISLVALFGGLIFVVYEYFMFLKNTSEKLEAVQEFGVTE
jgi:TRAP transporter 4TM/12TM fusion protein